MAEQLRAVLERQRAFVADASHQLRTPLTALRLRLENLEDAVDPSRRDELEATVGEIGRLTLLVEQLLQLARADHRRQPVGIRLDEVVRDRADTWQAVAALGGVTVEARLPAGETWVALEPGAAEQVLDNLIDNALAVCPPGTTLDLVLTRTAGLVELHVTDHGPGLTDADKARALDRFWRGSTATEGTGLGLPIVANLIAVHGGTLMLRDTPGGGLDVHITLPAGRGEVAGPSTPPASG
jgi:signal transduction histidine kinase